MPVHLLQIAKKLAHDAGKLTLEYQKKGFKVETKGSHLNLVTEADKASEALITKTIKRNFPDHSIITEESEAYHGNSDYKWIIDPLDGTTNFAHGIPIYAISIAVTKAGKPVIGVVEIPCLGETFWAQEGKGAFLGKKQIQVSKVNDVKESVLATGFPYDRGSARYKKNIELFDAFYQPSHGVRRFGVAAIDLCFVAAGRFDGMWEYGLEPWDIAAGKIIIEEAGGMVTNMDGTKLSPRKKNILATNGRIHSEMLTVIKKLGGDQI